MAYKRNNGQPTYDFPDYFDFIYPMVNTKYYHTDSEGRVRQGGLFTLDGVHPSAISQGLLAYEFLKVMNAAGVVMFMDKNAWDGFSSKGQDPRMNGGVHFTQNTPSARQLFPKEGDYVFWAVNRQAHAPICKGKYVKVGAANCANDELCVDLTSQ